MQNGVVEFYLDNLSDVSDVTTRDYLSQKFY